MENIVYQKEFKVVGISFKDRILNLKQIISNGIEVGSLRPYLDKSILDMITNLNVEVTIVTRKFNLLKDIDIKKYNRQYHNLKVIYSDKFHDRFVILDKKVLYHSGASFKDLGNKCFAINKIEDNEYLKNILKKIKE